MAAPYSEEARDIVFRYASSMLDKTDGTNFTRDDVYTVWSCYILGNRKYLFSTNLPDGMYYEVTYDAIRCVYYLDAYKKFHNEVIDAGA